MLFPIDWREPFGLVMIEAMACGTPVIAYRCGPVPEVIEDGVTGFIVENEEQAVLAVNRLARPDRRKIRARSRSASPQTEWQGSTKASTANWSQLGLREERALASMFIRYRRPRRVHRLRSVQTSAGLAERGENFPTRQSKNCCPILTRQDGPSR